jgi:hypothetical protein
MLLQQAYNILIKELLDTNKDILLQITIKIINNTTSPNRLTPTLLIWGIYLKISQDSVLVLLVEKRNATYWYIKIKLERIKTKRQINNIFGIRNSPNKTKIKNLPIQSDILV